MGEKTRFSLLTSRTNTEPQAPTDLVGDLRKAYEKLGNETAIEVLNQVIKSGTYDDNPLGLVTAMTTNFPIDPLETGYSAPTPPASQTGTK